ncbi:hypothetical protein KSF_000010 [Reticulibacter mediterranei]|uniref:Uncharacterized protein n=1 Tax=Reticulibacter mediterranei TaxID=2778369 RepID=A0A8J3ICJ8_9CHLR|nr:hypothetical protein KSF_000010 [Reticulibacter mediterranei]
MLERITGTPRLPEEGCRKGSAGHAWNKRDLLDVLPVSVLEECLNPYQVPSYEAVALTGKGVIECLRAGINATLLSLGREER